MSSPSIAFTDPTGLSKVAPTIPFVGPMRTLAPFRTATQLPNNFHLWALAFKMAKAPDMRILASPRVPIPPMGRQVVLTFPPVYRTREDVMAGGNQSPRLFPPIVLTKIWGSG